jgi:hypothetical protein
LDEGTADAKEQLKQQLQAQSTQQQLQAEVVVHHHQTRPARQQRALRPVQAGANLLKATLRVVRRIPSAVHKLGNTGSSPQATATGGAASNQMPVHAAALCGAVVGLLFYSLKLRAVAPDEFGDGDVPCAVGGCFRQDALDRYRKKYAMTF